VLSFDICDCLGRCQYLANHQSLSEDLPPGIRLDPGSGAEDPDIREKIRQRIRPSAQ
jgi:hypothetical protein